MAGRAGRGRPWTAVAGRGRPWTAVAGRGRPWTAVDGRRPPWPAVDGRGPAGGRPAPGHNPYHSKMLTRSQRFWTFLTKTERGNEKSCISPLFLKQNSLHARDLDFWFFPGREFSFDFLWFLQHFPSARRRTWDFFRKCCSRTTFWTGFGKRKSRVIGKNIQGNPGALRELREIQRGDYALFLKVICNFPGIQKCHSVPRNLIGFSEMLL